MLCACRVLVVASLMLACARTASPGTVVAEAEPVDSSCESDRLEACVEACFDATCLDWCAGSSCRVAVGEVWMCMDEVEQTFERANPEPVFSPAPDVDEATLEALAVQWFAQAQAWTAAHEAARESGWVNVCKPACVERVPSSGFCERDTPKHETWSYAQLTCGAPMRSGWIPISHVREPAGISLEVVGARVREMKWNTLSHLVGNQAEQLANARACVKGDEPVDLVFGVELDPSGTPSKIELVEGAPETGACVVAILERAFILPARVVADFPRIELGVNVRPNE